MENYFIQTKNVKWLDTPIDTVWVETKNNYIQPDRFSLRRTVLGVNLRLIEDEMLFKPLKIIDVTEQLRIEGVMPRFIGMAVDLSDEAKRHLCVDEEEELNEYLPCKAYETDEIALVDGSRLIWLEDSPENVAHYVHRSMLVINGA